MLWTSPNPPSDFKALQEALDELKGSHVVHLLDFTPQVQQLAQQRYLQGWYAQQIVKLKVASQLPADVGNYLVLDSKNTFMKDVTEDMFVDTCGRACIFATEPFRQMPGVHAAWYRSSAGQLGFSGPRSGDWWPESITPMVLNRATVLGLLQKIGEDPDPYHGLCAGRLCDMLTRGATEFTLYMNYESNTPVDKCWHTLDRIATGQELLVQGLWRGLSPRRDCQRAQDVASGALRPVFFGVQRDSLLSVAGGERVSVLNNIVRIYQTAGLLNEDPGPSTGEDLIRCIG